jgi:hypothetical protein
MGDHASNIRVIPHDQVGAGCIGFRLAKHFTHGGYPTWTESTEISLADYQTVHLAAGQSQFAFDAEAVSAWGSWYTTTFPTVQERAMIRARVQKVLP